MKQSINKSSFKVLNVHCNIFRYGSLTRKMSQRPFYFISFAYMYTCVAYEAMSRKVRSFTTCLAVVRFPGAILLWGEIAGGKFYTGVRFPGGGNSTMGWDFRGDPTLGWDFRGHPTLGWDFRGEILLWDIKRGKSGPRVNLPPGEILPWGEISGGKSDPWEILHYNTGMSQNKRQLQGTTHHWIPGKSIFVGINYCGFYFRDSVYSARNLENKKPAKISHYTVYYYTSLIRRIRKYDWSRAVTWREDKSSCLPADVVSPCRPSKVSIHWTCFKVSNPNQEHHA